MRIVKVNEATERELDWLVGELEFRRFLDQGSHVKEWVLEDHRKGLRTDPYSTSYEHGSPIIDREFIVTAEQREVGTTESGVEYDRIVGWKAHVAGRFYWSTVKVFYGPTHLVAAMRAYVGSKFGDEAEVPDELPS